MYFMNNFQNTDCIDLILKESYRNPRFLADINVDSKLYLKKIDKYASFEKCYIDDTLAGLVAYYCNNLESKEAFITIVLVDYDFRGLGIAQNLMNKVIDIIRSKDFTKCSLEVSLKNTQVIRLYEKLNYVETHRNADSAFMSVLV